MAKILIVDDEVDTCRVMRRVFAKRGWTSDCCHDSADALTAVRATRPDAVLLDVMMPGSDGFAILAAIRGDPDVSTVPVLFYSALHDEATVNRALDAGADDYIPKLSSAQHICGRLSLFMPDDSHLDTTPDW
jgi:DNA-binding response OmpR family regulator